MLPKMVVLGCPSHLCHIFKIIDAIRFKLCFRARLLGMALGLHSRATWLAFFFQS